MSTTDPPADPHAHHSAGRHGHPGVGTHGMLVIGTEPVYLSHLPMFHPPHNFQVLLEARLAKDGTDATGVYRRDRETSGEKLYTLSPEKFALHELVGTAPSHPGRASFGGTLFRGHFERGGDELLSDLTVDVAGVTYFRELEPPHHGTATATQDITYICFGAPERRFLAHEITGPPNFDHILAVRFVDEDVARMTFPLAPVTIRDREDALEHRMREGETVTGFLFQTIGPEGQHGFSTPLAIEEELYLESEELRG
jgi:hypothetical protein